MIVLKSLLSFFFFHLLVINIHSYTQNTNKQNHPPFMFSNKANPRSNHFMISGKTIPERSNTSTGMERLSDVDSGVGGFADDFRINFGHCRIQLP